MKAITLLLGLFLALNGVCQQVTVTPKEGFQSEAEDFALNYGFDVIDGLCVKEITDSIEYEWAQNDFMCSRYFMDIRWEEDEEEGMALSVKPTAAENIMLRQQFYTITGMPVDEPQAFGLYIVRRLYSDGSITSDKIVH